MREKKQLAGNFQSYEKDDGQGSENGGNLICISWALKTGLNLGQFITVLLGLD